MHFIRRSLLLLAFVCVLIPGTVPVAHANAISVTSLLDTSGNPSICTLRDAILAANTNAIVGGCPAGSPYPTMDTITIQLGRTYCLLNPCTIILSSLLPTITEDVSIAGVVGSKYWTPTISGASAYRVFDLGGVNVNLSNLNIINGYATGISDAGYGGAIRMSSLGTTLLVTNVYFSGNHAQTRGGAMYLPVGTAAISNTTFFNNTVDSYGGAIDQLGGVLIVSSSTIVGNSASDGGGIEIQSASDTRLTNVTLSGNTATNNGGAISRIGTAYVVSLNNVTITNNTADSDNNGSGDGGGIYRGGGTIGVGNSIIAGNFDTPNNSGGGTRYPDCSWNNGGGLTSYGHNLLGRSDGCAGLTDGVNGDKVGTNASPINPLLSPLAYNGGPTPTHALIVGSPALDAGSPLTPGGGGYGACDAYDQRGTARPVGALCDMGAYEGQTDAKIFLPLVFR